MSISIVSLKRFAIIPSQKCTNNNHEIGENVGNARASALPPHTKHDRRPGCHRRRRSLPNSMRGHLAASTRQQGLSDERVGRLHSRSAGGVGGREA